jgi:ATP/maltotriose-dependent transcriptional regulator MalT
MVMNDTVGDRVTVLEDGLEALNRHDWPQALALLDAGPLTDVAAEAERLDLLGEALWWMGRIDDCTVAREHAYALFEDLAAHRRSGQVAIWIYEHHCFKGRPAIASGWLGRARRALDGDADCVEWGNLLLREAEMAHGAGDYAQAIDNATEALALGRRLHSANLEAEALQTLGRVVIDDGRPREGIAMLDEAMLLAIEGRLGPYAAGKVYCSLVGACQDLGDLHRAAEWTDATTRWSEQHPFAIFPGLCRVKRAEVLQWRGDWVEAEREARLACEELAETKVGSAGSAWVEIGEIRRRLGDLDGAEAAFAKAQELCCMPTAGLALLRLAQGRVDVARALVAGTLGDEGLSRLARAKILPAAAQVAIAADDLAAAQRAADELDEIASTYDTPALKASAYLTRGRVQLAVGDADAAIHTLRHATEEWQALDVPYEAATAQLLVGEACRRTGDRDGEVVAFAAAAAAFDRLGATLDSQRIRELTSGVEYPSGLTEREAEVLQLVAAGCTNKEIARQLLIADKTVSRHLSNIFGKTGVTTRTAAAAFAFEHGLAGTVR